MKNKRWVRIINRNVDGCEGNPQPGAHGTPKEPVWTPPVQDAPAQHPNAPPRGGEAELNQCFTEQSHRQGYGGS